MAVNREDVAGLTEAVEMGVEILSHRPFRPAELGGFRGRARRHGGRARRHAMDSRV